MYELLIRFIKDESGNSAIQYGVLSTAVTGAMIGPLTKIGQELSHVFEIVARAMAVH